MEGFDELRQVPIFASLSGGALSRLESIAHLVQYQNGQVIVLEGEVGAPVFFVVTGTVRVYRTNLDGREQTLIYLKAGDGLNIPTAFSASKAAPASATAVGSAQLLAASNEDFRQVTTQTPEIAQAILADFSEKLRHLTELTYDLSLLNVRARLARFVLEQAETEPAAPLHWTQEQIAAQIGTVREVVSRTLRAFADAGLIEIDRQRIVILDPLGLETEAQA